jgi:predicted nucleotidyltransferase
MKNKLLDISNKLDAGTVSIYRDVAEVAEALAIDYLVVGASGRDLILRYAYDVEIQRATNDYDFAFEVGNQAKFESLRSALLEKDFQQGKQPQRLISPRGVDIDLVPFGDIADQAGNITLPPDHNHQMSVLGFAEALADTQMVRMSHKPLLDVPVVSLPGLLLLKLVAWGDRPRDLRSKDAQDFRYVIESYLKIPFDVTNIFDETDYLERFDDDIERVAAAVLGRLTRDISSDKAYEVVKVLLTGNQLDAFILDMDVRYAVSPSDSPKLVAAFTEGFVGSR